MDELEFHPLADIFPLIMGDDFKALCEDVRAHGVREPIVLFDGKILDGRNRYRAARAVGKKCPSVLYDGADPVGYVVSLNLHRRHLNESQRAMAAARLATLSDGQRADLARCSNLGTLAQPEAAKRMKVSRGSVQHATVVRDNPVLAPLVDSGQVKVSAAAAIAKESPEFHMAFADLVDSGLKPPEALRQARKQFLPKTVAALPAGKYRVIYADPPWAYGDSRQTGDHRQSTGSLSHYNVESTDDLCAMPVEDMAADDSVLLCWATFPLLTDALRVVAAWGFKYKTAFVWDKGHGAFGNYHDADAELLLVATRGSCTPEAETKEKQVQRWPRARHSAKPEETRAMIDKLWSHGPRIELFRRGEAPAGWSVWGAEAEEVAA